MNFVFRFPEPSEPITTLPASHDPIPDPPAIPAHALDVLAPIHKESLPVAQNLYNKVYYATPDHITMRLDQLEPALRCHFGQDRAVCIAATGSGKTMQIVSSVILNPQAVTLVLSPLKLLQGSMVRTVHISGPGSQLIQQEKLAATSSIRPIAINQDMRYDADKWQVRTTTTSHMELFVSTPREGHREWQVQRHLDFA